MPAFAKNPKFIVSVIVILWVTYVLWANLRPEPIRFHLIPFAATIDFNLSAIIVGSAIFGSAVTLIVQRLWRRRSSKNASVSATASAASTKTMA